MEGKIISNARLDAYVAVAVACLVKKEKRGGLRQSKYADMYGRLVEPASRQQMENDRKLVKHW